MYYLTACSTNNALFSRNVFSTLFLFRRISTSLYFKAVQTCTYMLPVFFFYFFPRLVNNPPFFTEPDISLLSKRFFTLYSTALLAYKRNSEMYSSSMLPKIKQLKHHIRNNVKHNSVRSLRIGSIMQSMLFKRIASIFKRKRKRYKRKKRAKRKYARQRHK
jgi:hypothetical protein